MFIGPYWQQFHHVEIHWHLLNGVIVSIFSFVALLLNISSLYLVLKVKGVKNGDDYFLLNLSVADLAKCFLAVFNIISSFSGEWKFGKFGCDLYGFFMSYFSFLTISTVVFMTIERFILVKNPLSVLKCEKRFIFGCILITWFYPLLILLPYVYKPNMFQLEGILTSCSIDFLSRDTFTRLAYLNMLLMGFVLPYLIMLVFYGLIIYELCPYTRKKNFSIEFRKSQRARKMRQDVAATKAAAIVILAFLFAWTPYAIVCTYGQFGSDIEPIIQPLYVAIAACFAKVSSIFNPALYTLCNNQCKSYFIKKFFKRKSLRGSNQFMTSSNHKLNTSLVEKKRKEYLEIYPSINLLKTDPEKEINLTYL